MHGTIPVTVVTGFLGAGKTTLVNRWLAAAPVGDFAVIVNEYGATGVDGELLATRARELVELTGGCVCCTTYTELVRALDRFATCETPPKRILIETSGAASPAGVLRATAAGGKSGALRLDGVITCFDATRVEQCLEHEVAFEQLGFADVVILTRADSCPAHMLSEARERLSIQNAAALFVAAARGELLDPELCSLPALLERRASLPGTPDPNAAEYGVMQSGSAERRATASGDGAVPLVQVASVTPAHPARFRLRTPSAHSVYESVSLEYDGELDGERFAEFVEAEVAQFAGRIFRIKGILAIEGLAQRMLVQGVADAVEIAFGEPWHDGRRSSRLVVVGFALDADALGRGFNACAKC